jgi:hypothetical protein
VPAVSAAAICGVTIEIAERVETAITKAKKWWSARRATRRKVAILAAKSISTSTLMDWTFSPLGMNPMRKRVRNMPPRGDVSYKKVREKGLVRAD